MSLWRDPTEADKKRWHEGPDPEPWWWIERCTAAETSGPRRVVFLPDSAVVIEDREAAVERMEAGYFDACSRATVPGYDYLLDVPALMRELLATAIGEEQP